MPETQVAEIPAPVESRPAIADARFSLKNLRRDYAQLSKLRLNAMVVFTTAVGFLAATTGGFSEIDWLKLLGTSVGVMLAAMGASAFNQAIESKTDARMNRTKNRPVASGRMSRKHALIFGLWTSVIGVAILCPSSNGLAAILTAGNILLYALIYTPLKRVSTTNTLVGAVVGAIPPVIGWVACEGKISEGAIVLGALLFMWQIPHFLALAWIYRADYARGGYKMLPNVDPTGRRTATTALLYSVALIFIGLAAARTGVTSYIFLVSTIFLGLWLTYRAFDFAMKRTDESAKKLFLFSVLYLPVLLIVMLSDVQNLWRAKVLDLGTHIMFKTDFRTPAQAAEDMERAKIAAEKLQATTQPAASQTSMPK